MAERIRIKVGQGVTGQAVQRREAVLVNDVAAEENFINSAPGVRSELAVPLIAKNKVIGVIDVEADQPGAFTEEHKRLLTLFASRIAVGIENARLYTRVVAAGAAAHAADRDQPRADLDPERRSVAEAHCRPADPHHRLPDVFHPAARSQRKRPAASLLAALQGERATQARNPLGAGLVGYAAQHGQAVLVPDVSKDPRYIKANPETRSELCIPLIYKDKVIGVLDIEHTRRNYFNEDHVRIMTTMAAQVAIAIENATLYERIARQEKRLEQDLALARELQFRLLPQKLPVFEERRGGVALRSGPPDRRRPVRLPEVQRPRRHRHCGRRRQRQGRARRHLRSAGQRHRALARHRRAQRRRHAGGNQPLARRAAHRRSVRLDDLRHLGRQPAALLQLANSGLPRPLHCRDGKFEEIPATGLPIGLFTNATYDELNLRGKPGRCLPLLQRRHSRCHQFEGRDVRRASAGERSSATTRVGSAEELVDAIFTAVSDHAEGVEAFDDQTIVALKVKGPSAKK